MEDFSPISRLEIIINKIKEQNSAQSVKVVLSHSFEVSRSNSNELYDHVFEYLRLVDIVEATFKALIPDFDNNEIYQKAFYSLKKVAFFIESQKPFKDLRLIDDSVGMLLGVGKNYYRDFNSRIESRVGGDCFEELRESLEEFFNSLMSSSLPRPLRLRLMTDVINMKKAMLFYLYRGADGVEETMSSLSGRMLLNKKDMAQYDDGSVGESFKFVYDKYFSFVTQANASYQFIENIGNYFLGDK